MGTLDLRGMVNLEEISALGDMNSLKAIGKIKGDKVFARVNNDTHSVSELNIFIDSLLNLSDTSKSTENDILPILENVTIHNFFILYNGIKINLDGSIYPKTNIDCDLTITGVDLEKFVNTLKGNLDLKVKIYGEKLSYLKIDSSINLNKFRYFLGSSISGRNQIDSKFKTTIDLGSGFKFEDLQLDQFFINIINENKQIATSVKTKLDLDMKSGLKVKIYDLILDIDSTKLIPTLPLTLKGTIANLRNSLGNNLKFNGKVNYSKKSNLDLISAELLSVLPGIELKDLLIQLEVDIKKDKSSEITIQKFILSGFENKLKANYKGKFYKPFTANPPFGDFTGNLEGNFTLESPEYRYVTKGLYFKGDIDFNLKIDGALISGNLLSKSSNFKIKDKCPGDTCTETEIAGIMMKIPFTHDLNDKSMENLLGGNSENFIQNYGLTKEPNFTIDRITSNHPTEIGSKFDFIKSNEKNSGISAFLDYKENFLSLDNLKINTLGGMIYGKDFIVNVGTGDPSKIQYSAILQIRDIDLKQILPSSSRKKIGDGKIKGDLNISGSNLTDPIGNLDLFFSIFQIGEDFGRSAVNIVSPTNFVTDRIINSYSVNKIEVEINHGLVYSRVLFNKSIINSLVFQVENDRIQQERIPLANFLKRAENEFSEYK